MDYGTYNYFENKKYNENEMKNLSAKKTISAWPRQSVKKGNQNPFRMKIAFERNIWRSVGVATG